jgi:transcription termination factor NusB
MSIPNLSKIIVYAQEFEGFCNDALIKIAYIRKRDGKWVILSEKGKVLGTYDTKEKAVERLRQIEYFKHHKKKKASKEDSYSSIMRDLRKSSDEDTIKCFQEKFKKAFDKAIIDGNEEPEKIALETAMENIRDENELMEKAASAINLGDPETAGKYLSDLIKFLLRRISADRRPRAIESMKRKIYYINEYQIAQKKTPPSSSMGQSITLLKTILLEHDPQYIRGVLNSIVKHL